MNTDRLLIAEFARRARLPVSALRYYDRIGLLSPVEIDPHSGYRRYSSDQLVDAMTIAQLREIGTSPDTIARVLAGGSARAHALASERHRLDREIRDRTHALARLDQLGPPRACTPRNVELVAGRVPALPFTGPAANLSATVKRSVAMLRARLRRCDIAATRWGALLPLDLTEQVSGFVFADVHTNVPVLDESPLDVVTLPSGNGVRAIYEGGHDSLAYAYNDLLAEIDQTNGIPTSPVLERYSGTEDTARTEITVLANWANTR